MEYEQSFQQANWQKTNEFSSTAAQDSLGEDFSRKKMKLRETTKN
jgi:hypothetical protein